MRFVPLPLPHLLAYSMRSFAQVAEKTDALLPLMAKVGRGRIINMTSGYGRLDEQSNSTRHRLRELHQKAAEGQMTRAELDAALDLFEQLASQRLITGHVAYYKLTKCASRAACVCARGCAG